MLLTMVAARTRVHMVKGALSAHVTRVTRSKQTDAPVMVIHISVSRNPP